MNSQLVENSGPRFTCDWLQTMLVVLSDGQVVCGCADPYGQRPLGHLRDQSLSEIWRSEKVAAIRRDLNQGFCDFCQPCGLKRMLAKDEPPPVRAEHIDSLPRIFLEPTVACNLDCFQAVCRKETGIVKTRARSFFPLDEFEQLLAEIGPGLGRLDLFNYGDPFVHPQALDMIEHVKGAYPHVYLYISSNGLLLDPDKNRRLIEAGLDEITFSVDGPNQAIYERYRCGGDFTRVMANMADLVRQRAQLGRILPIINWRSILFNWNDSRLVMNKMRRLAARVGVDRLTWEITDHPPAAKSARYQPGTPAWKKIFYEIWDTSQLTNAIKGKHHLARIRVLSRPLPMDENARIGVRVKNIGGALWRKQTGNGRQTIRLGAQLFDEQGRLIDLNFARAFLPHDVKKGQWAGIEIELSPPPQPGHYQLKLDMVSEGVDWFERAGSEVVWLNWQV